MLHPNWNGIVNCFLDVAQEATSRIGEVNGQETVVWESPAFSATVVFDLTSFGGRDPEANNDVPLEGEEFLRKVQTELRGDQETNQTLGVLIDVGLTFEEQLGESMPFVLLAVVGILFLVGALLRSYWAAALVGVGLAITMLWYNAVLTAIGFEGGLLLGFIGPVSVIAFGVDFFVHASGRAREEQVAGLSRDRSYPRGMTLVFPGLAVGGRFFGGSVHLERGRRYPGDRAVRYRHRDRASDRIRNPWDRGAALVVDGRRHAR